VALLDEVSTTVKVCNACNAVLKRPDGTLYGEMFDGAGFTRGVALKGVELRGAAALVVGAGGVGSAIAASLAAAGVARLVVFDTRRDSAEALAARLRQYYPALDARYGPADPAGLDVAVNATPLGMNPDDPLPMDVT